MTCEVLENLISARCSGCSLRISEEVHVLGLDCMSAPLRLVCRDCCPCCKLRTPTFEAVMAEVQDDLF